MADTNMRVGSQPTEGVVVTFGEDTCSRSGELRREVPTFNQVNLIPSSERKIFTRVLGQLEGLAH